MSLIERKHRRRKPSKLESAKADPVIRLGLDTKQFDDEFGYLAGPQTEDRDQRPK